MPDGVARDAGPRFYDADMILTVGDQAPDFVLPGTLDGIHRTYSLAEFRGRPVVLVFYPGDNTPVCTRQLNTYTDDVARFSEIGAAVLAISPQGLVSHDGFANTQGGFAFPLLADEDRAVARSYGVLGPLGFYRRSVFVVDHEGTFTWFRRGHAASTFRSVDEIISAVSGR